MTQARKAAGKGAAEASKKTRKLPVLPVAFGAIALLLVVVIVFTGGVGVTEVGDPEIDGTALPFLGGAGQDPAVGMEIPEVSSTDYTNEATAIEKDGRPKVLIFLAHWCPHCQAEVPVVQAWIDAGLAPSDVDIVSVATAINSARPNYPPSDWFERENWTPPVLMDDSSSSIGQAFGVTGYPFWVFVDPDGEVTARTSGEISIDALEGFIDAARAG
jgi:cytochrome c biogenesis protein CcmG, thiol:disulfide interchange protein DsbE